MRNSFRDEYNGAKVWIHTTHNGPERIDNEQIAKILADNGEEVHLLPIGDKLGVKNPDAAIGEEIWEFKTNRVGTTNSVNNEIRRAHRQANHILLWLAVEMDLSKLENAIYNRVRQCNSLIECRFIVVGVLYEFTRFEILNQTFRGKLSKKGEEGLA